MPEQAKEKVVKCLADAAGTTQKAARASLEAPRGNFGDLASTIAFALAKEKKENPALLAQAIAEKLAACLPPQIASASCAGPYINFAFSDTVWLSSLSDFSSPDFGRGKHRAGKVLLESPSVNPNKPWHVGHLRNALLGDSLARLLRFAGSDVELEDYIDDLGLQVAQSIWGMEHLGPLPGEKFDHARGKQYVEVAKRVAEPAIEAEVRAIISELEEGHSLLAKNARATVEKCVAAQYETAFSYGICHDVLVFESDVMRTLFSEGMEKLKSSGALRLESEGKNAGCYVVPLSGELEFAGMESADKILLRSDGTATYTGKDVVFQLWKFGKLSAQLHFVPFLRQPNGQAVFMSSYQGPAMKFGGATKVVNVIGMEQAYPQKVLKVILRRLGFEGEAGNSHHLSYEHAVLPEGRFSGREGTWMSEGGMGYTADELLQEGKRRALEKIKAEVGQGEREEIAQAVALGAIRFSFLRTSADKKITFVWDKALSFEGDSGPYIQYAYARASRILEKAGEINRAAPDSEYHFSNEEKLLLRQLALFPEVVSSCELSLQVHPMAEYALELASLFSKFYATTPVLAKEVGEKERAVRLLIVWCARNALFLSLFLLGIPAIERM